MQRINAGILQTTAIGAVLALGLWASPAALAQEAPAPAPTPAPEAEATETAESEETIVVTGSRLKVPDYDRSGPVSSVTGAQIQQAGVVNLTDFLQEVPALVNSFDSEDSADTGGQAQAGLNLLNLRNLGEDRTLVLVDGRRYSRLTRDLALAARDEGIPVTLITDPYCDWAPGAVTELFAVPTELNHFWDTTSAMSSLIGLMVNGVFRELGAEVEDRMARVSALYGDFIGHTAPGRNPGRS